MKTELIENAKFITMPDGKELVLIVTKSGAQVWAQKNQWNEEADVVTFKPCKAGVDSYVSKKDVIRDGKTIKAGDPIPYTKDTNEFFSIGRQRVAKASNADLIRLMGELGMQNAVQFA